MQKKFFSRMGLTIINKCNQKCSWCFEGAWKSGTTQIMSLKNIRRLMEWKDWEDGFTPVVFILGGEPTLHPQLLDIFDLITEYNHRISKMLLTNLTCDNALLEELLNKKAVIFANIDQFEPDNNVKNQSKILSNLNYLNTKTDRNFQYNISATVSSLEKDFTFLYEILKSGKDKIYNLRLAPSCIGFEFKNQFQKSFGDEYFNKVFEVLTECLKIKPDLHLSTECAINGCMINGELFTKLKNIGYNLRYSCGEPEPNADILPEMSSHWCFAMKGIPELSINNVFDYANYNSMIDALSKKYREFSKKYTHCCNIGNCGYEQCKGPCAALNYYKNIL